MSQNLRIGNNIYVIPDPKQNPSWGEDLTKWIIGINEAVNNLFGSNDLLTTTSNLSNNTTTFSDINGLKFNISEVLDVSITYYVKREYDSGSSVVVESGVIVGHYDGSEFYIERERLGDAGIDIDVLNSGQFVYKSSDLTDHVSSIIYFKANTLDK